MIAQSQDAAASQSTKLVLRPLITRPDSDLQSSSVTQTEWVNADNISAGAAAISTLAALAAVVLTVWAAREHRRSKIAERRSAHFEKHVLEPVRAAVPPFVLAVTSTLKAGEEQLSFLTRDDSTHSVVLSHSEKLVAQFQEHFYQLKQHVSVALASWPDPVLAKKILDLLNQLQDDFLVRIQQMPLSKSAPNADFVDQQSTKILRDLVAYDLALFGEIQVLPKKPRKPKWKFWGT